MDGMKGNHMMRILDEVWYRLLDRMNLWILDRLAAHCRREKLRRFRSIMGTNRAFLN
jgi:hypothetical protein